ncbi:MAG: sugar ABC transporter ATP-binding protein, partial [Anaerolinea sp.]|nr:sugar ABC transporter ATP-binding protein [Anaerolinea sp.]
ALLGENGAGKSTLCKALAGVVTLTKGEIQFQGRPVSFNTPGQALAAGITMVFQETSLVPTMTVAQNIFLGKETTFIELRHIYIQAQQILQSLGFHVDPRAPVARLSAAQKQMVEIARAVFNKAAVIIFDEPTATLTPEEKQHFFTLVGKLKRQQVAIIFISHAIEEALEVADRISVLRDGRLIATEPTSRLNRAEVVRLMVGRHLEIERKHPGEKRPRGRKVLSVENVIMGEIVKNTSFSRCAG